MTRTAIIFVAAIVASASAACAGFVGSPIGLEYRVEDLGTMYYSFAKRFAGPVDGASQTPEFVAFPEEPATFDVDFSDGEIFIDRFSTGGFFDSVSFNGLIFDDVDERLAPFASVRVIETNFAGLDESRFTVFDADHLHLNWQGLTFATDTTIRLGVEFAVGDSPAQAIPTPSAAPAGAALLLSALFRRRRTLA